MFQFLQTSDRQYAAEIPHLQHGHPWQFPAGLSIVAWIDYCNYGCDFITNEDLHREGLSALKLHNCVVTGIHPEYISEKMLGAQEDYVAEGGRLIYMGDQPPALF